MSNIIAALLGADQPFFSMSIDRLEKASGQPAEDIRLSLEILQKYRRKLRELGLDPNDTTPKELYFSLLSLAKLHDKFLARRLTGLDNPPIAKLLKALPAFIESLDIADNCWVIKPVVAKRLLKSWPPPTLMKHLHFRSVDSMTKRLPIEVIFSITRISEDESWQSKLLTKYAKLTPKDFEQRPVKIVGLDGAKWLPFGQKQLARKHHNIAHSKELGAILILPVNSDYRPGLALSTILTCLHYIQEIRTFSSYHKLQQTRSDFGELVYLNMAFDPGRQALMARHPLHWRTIHRSYGRRPKHQHPEIFEPYLNPKDLEWRPSEDLLYNYEPALQFWHQHEYVGVLSPVGGPVSFNLLDNAINLLNNRPYGHHVSTNFIKALRHELDSRYLNHSALENEVLSQLDNGSLDNELVIWQERQLI